MPSQLTIGRTSWLPRCTQVSSSRPICQHARKETSRFTKCSLTAETDTSRSATSSTGSSVDETLSSLDALLQTSSDALRIEPGDSPVLPETDAATQGPQPSEALPVVVAPAASPAIEPSPGLFNGTKPILQELRETSPQELFNFARQMALKQMKDYVKPTKIVDENFVLPRVKPRVAYLVLALNLGVYLYGLTLRFTEGDDAPLRYFDSLANVNAGIENGEYYRLLTSNFLHDSFVHLAVSSYALFTIAPEAESILGVLAFLTTYVLGGVAGSSFCFLLTDTVTVGASTGIFGLIGAMGSFLYKNHRAPQASDQVLFAIGTLLFNLFLGGNHETTIDNLGHMGGLICGIYLGYLLTPLIEVDESEANSADSQEAGASGSAAFPVDLSKSSPSLKSNSSSQGPKNTGQSDTDARGEERRLRVYQPNPLQSFIVLFCVSLTLGSGVAATILHRTGQLPLPHWPVF